MVGRLMGHGGKIIAVLVFLGLLSLTIGLAYESDLVISTGIAISLFSISIGIQGLLAIRRVRERWLSDDAFRHAALKDPLTGLPNRVYFRDRLNEALVRAEEEHHPMALLCVKLDEFNDVIDTLGRQKGDILLIQAGQRLKKVIRSGNLICRLDGDTFAIALENIGSLQDAAKLAEQICVRLSENYVADGIELAASASVGIAVGPMDGASADDLIKNAELAVQRAKDDGGNTFRYFEQAMDAAFLERRALSAELLEAIKNQDFELHYQPQLELGSGHIVGYEALIRWNHPTRGLIPPGLFLPIAEDNGLMEKVGEWVLWSACSYAAIWPDESRLAINLSPEKFSGQDIAALVRRVLRETGLAAERLELEISENCLLRDSDSVIKSLSELSATGVSITIDDFGTGYASLRCLGRVPINKIKIDRSLISGLGRKSDNDSMVKTIIAACKSHGAESVAVGVECGIQAGYLQAWGCDLAQGFFYGEPKPDIIAVCLDDLESDFPGAA